MVPVVEKKMSKSRLCISTSSILRFADLGGFCVSFFPYQWFVGQKSGMYDKGVAFGSMMCMELR